MISRNFKVLPIVPGATQKFGEFDHKKSFLSKLLVSTVSFKVVPLGMYTAIQACCP